MAKRLSLAESLYAQARPLALCLAQRRARLRHRPARRTRRRPRRPHLTTVRHLALPSS